MEYKEVWDGNNLKGNMLNNEDTQEMLRLVGHRAKEYYFDEDICTAERIKVYFFMPIDSVDIDMIKSIANRFTACPTECGSDYKSPDFNLCGADQPVLIAQLASNGVRIWYSKRIPQYKEVIEFANSVMAGNYLAHKDTGMYNKPHMIIRNDMALGPYSDKYTAETVAATMIDSDDYEIVPQEDKLHLVECLIKDLTYGHPAYSAFKAKFKAAQETDFQGTTLSEEKLKRDISVWGSTERHNHKRKTFRVYRNGTILRSYLYAHEIKEFTDLAQEVRVLMDQERKFKTYSGRLDRSEKYRVLSISKGDMTMTPEGPLPVEDVLLRWDSSASEFYFKVHKGKHHLYLDDYKFEGQNLLSLFDPSCNMRVDSFDLLFVIMVENMMFIRFYATTPENLDYKGYHEQFGASGEFFYCFESPNLWGTDFAKIRGIVLTAAKEKKEKLQV